MTELVLATRNSSYLLGVKVMLLGVVLDETKREREGGHGPLVQHRAHGWYLNQNTKNMKTTRVDEYDIYITNFKTTRSYAM